MSGRRGESPAPKASGNSITMGGIIVDFLVEAGETGGATTVFECVVAAGAHMPPPHSHDAFDETVYGLEGVFSFLIDGKKTYLGPGEVCFVRRGQVHYFENMGPEDGKFLSVATPGLFGPEYFRDIQRVMYASDGPPDREAMFEVMRRHGLTPAS